MTIPGIHRYAGHTSILVHLVITTYQPPKMEMRFAEITSLEIAGAIFAVLLMSSSLEERKDDPSDVITYICTQGRALAALQCLWCIAITDVIEIRIARHTRDLQVVAPTTRSGINFIEVARMYRNLSAIAVLLVFMAAYVCDLYAHFYEELDFSGFGVLATVVTACGGGLLLLLLCSQYVNTANDI